jgi:hypothetical protein
MTASEGDFNYADSFAGYAFNPLRSKGEWRYGIGKIFQSDSIWDDVNVIFWRSLWDCKTEMLGSLIQGPRSSFLNFACSKHATFGRVYGTLLPQ